MNKNTIVILALLPLLLLGCATSSIPPEKQKNYALLYADANFGQDPLSYVVKVDKETFMRSPFGSDRDVLPGRHSIQVDVCFANKHNALDLMCKPHHYNINAEAGLAYHFTSEGRLVTVYDRFNLQKPLYNLVAAGNSEYLHPDEAAALSKKNELERERKLALQKETDARIQARITERRKNNLPMVKKIGARICQEKAELKRFGARDQSVYVYIGYVESIADDKVQIRISDAYRKGSFDDLKIKPDGFTSSIIWDSPMNWDLCEK